MALSLDQAQGIKPKSAPKARSAKAKKAKTAKAKSAKAVNAARTAAAKDALKKVAKQAAKPRVVKARKVVKPWQKVDARAVKPSSAVATLNQIKSIVDQKLPVVASALINQGLESGLVTFMAAREEVLELSKNLNKDRLLDELRSQKALLHQRALKLQERLPLPRFIIQSLS